MEKPNMEIWSLVVLGLVLTGCDNWPPRGEPSEWVDGDEYAHTCDCTYDLLQGSGTTSGDTTVIATTCSNGDPDRFLGRLACNRKSREVQDNEQARRMSGSVINVRCEWRSQSLVSENACSIQEGTTSGNGIVSGLTATSVTSGVLFDPTGHLSGKSGSSSLVASVAQSSITVEAKFRNWQSASTTATGSIELDGGACRRGIQCPIVLRYMELDLADFNIVRPTGFARDVSLRDVKLRTLNNYRGRVDKQGRFQFDNIQAVVTATVDGKRGRLSYRIDSALTGNISDFTGTGRFTPRTVTLKFSDRNDAFGLSASVVFRARHFEARVKNVATAKCLRGRDRQDRPVPASIESCRRQTKPQVWLLEARRGSYRVRQPLTDSCLNLKTSSQNREGGPVEVVGCSNHNDQLWDPSSDAKLRHHATGKCLNVHRGNQNRNGGLVSVYSCANTDDQRWAIVGQAPQGQ